MHNVTRPLLALSALLLLATGCGSSGATDVSSDRPEASSTTAPADDLPPTDGRDPDQVVWQESTGGGFAPVDYSLSEVPDVTIYGDGRIFTAVPDPDASIGQPIALEQSKISAEDLTAFLDEAASSGLFDEGTDFGAPGVTDQPSTNITLHAGGSAQTVDVYALGFPAPDAQPGGRSMLSGEQTERRDELIELMAAARALADGGEAYVPTEVRATMFELGPGVDPPDDARPWPGPAFDEFPAPDDSGRSCLVVSGDDAAALFRSAGADEGITWERDGVSRQIVVVALLPGQEGCPS